MFLYISCEALKFHYRTNSYRIKSDVQTNPIVVIKKLMVLIMPNGLVGFVLIFGFTETTSSNDGSEIAPIQVRRMRINGRSILNR